MKLQLSEHLLSHLEEQGIVVPNEGIEIDDAVYAQEKAWIDHAHRHESAEHRHERLVYHLIWNHWEGRKKPEKENSGNESSADLAEIKELLKMVNPVDHSQQLDRIEKNTRFLRVMSFVIAVMLFLLLGAVAAHCQLDGLNISNNSGTIKQWAAGIAKVKCGTNLSCSLSNGIITIAPTTGTSGDISINLEQPAAADCGKIQHKFSQPVMLTRLSCSTDQGTVGMNLDLRAEATPNVIGSSALSSPLSCTTTTGATTSFATQQIVANAPFALCPSSPAGSPGIVRVHVTYQLQ